MTCRFKKNERDAKESSRVYRPAGNEDEEEDFDLSLLEESLQLTPWERMLANDDALKFAESLHAGMNRQHAES